MRHLLIVAVALTLAGCAADPITGTVRIASPLATPQADTPAPTAAARPKARRTFTYRGVRDPKSPDVRNARTGKPVVVAKPVPAAAATTAAPAAVRKHRRSSSAWRWLKEH